MGNEIFTPNLDLDQVQYIPQRVDLSSVLGENTLRDIDVLDTTKKLLWNRCSNEVSNISLR